tara:strand:- start:12 stop:722 length:711 start_codon:yes stop_codon:yes gene_type:complete
MLKLILITFIFFSIFSYSNENLIYEKISTILPPGTKIESIEKSEFPSVYKVYYGDIQPLYVSEDGDYFIFGDMFNLNSDGIINLTEKDILEKRKFFMQDIDDIELIKFTAKNELFSVVVFTDVDCGYCRKLHDEIKEYNNVGISINYAAFPRSGIGTETFTKMVGAWCSNNPKETITMLKKGEKLKSTFCDSQPIAKHYAIGNKIGVTGTPAIVSSDGELFPGYYSAEDLLKKLKG